MKRYPPRGEDDQPSALNSPAGRWTAEQLEAEYDPRLADVWISVFETWPDRTLPAELGWFLRMAYTTGYGDALTEEPGALFKNLGPIPAGALKAAASRRKEGRAR